jgi:hypothetical protein
MQGGRANTGRKTTPMSGTQSTRMTTNPQPAPVMRRPQAATPNVPRSGSRELARVDSAGLVEAGGQTTGGQQVQQVAPVLNNAGSA